jgi:hypothetical protein
MLSQVLLNLTLHHIVWYLTASSTKLNETYLFYIILSDLVHNYMDGHN